MQATRQWLVYDSGQIQGPITEHFLHMLIRNGTLGPDDAIADATTKQWQPLGTTSIWQAYQAQQSTSFTDQILNRYPPAFNKTDGWFQLAVWMPFVSMLLWYLVTFWHHIGSGASAFGIRMDMGAFNGFWFVAVLNIGSCVIDCWRLAATEFKQRDLWLYVICPPLYLYKRVIWTGAGIVYPFTYLGVSLLAWLVWFIIVA